MQKAPDLALRTIRRLASGDKSVKVQNPELVTKAPKLFRENCEINFDQTAEKVKNFINGVSPVPGAWKIWDGKNVKFLRATTSELAHLKKGEYEIKDKKFLIGCADKAIEILQLQSEGKKITSSTDFINGFHYVTRGMIE
jgi:methionyl-tRNA formyltransferase